MMRAVTAAVLSSCLLAFSPAQADTATQASACYGIADPNARTVCLARAHRDPGRCYGVTDQALRQQCLAEVRR